MKILIFREEVIENVIFIDFNGFFQKKWSENVIFREKMIEKCHFSEILMVFSRKNGRKIVIFEKKMIEKCHFYRF